MTFLAYLFTISVIVFIGAMVASGRSKDDEQKYYGAALLGAIVMIIAGLLMSAGVFELLPELTWK